MHHSPINFGRLRLATLAACVAAISGCVWFEKPVADKDHFSIDDRILGKWISDAREKLRVEVRPVDAATGLYEVIGRPVRLLNIDGLLTLTCVAPVGKDTDKLTLEETLTCTLLCEFGSDGKLRLFDLDERSVAKAIEGKQVAGSDEERRGIYLRVTSPEDMRAWIKAHRRTVFRTRPTFTFSPEK